MWIYFRDNAGKKVKSRIFLNRIGKAIDFSQILQRDLNRIQNTARQSIKSAKNSAFFEYLYSNFANEMF
jgi:hypothetical protein